MDIKIGDYVRIKNDDCVYRITAMPGTSALFPKDYRGVDEEDGRYGLLSPREIEGVIPRPEPRQVEWDGEGLPPVGERCLGKHKEFNSNFECVINGYRDGKVWFTDFMDTSEREFVYPLSQVEFRPVRTKDQREREELSECVAKAATLDAGIMLEEWQYDKIADAIIAAGWRKDQ